MSIVDQIYHNNIADVDAVDFKPEIYILGVGGAGCNAVANMINTDLDLSGLHFGVVNTDAQSLRAVNCKNVIQIGAKLTRGLGAGSDPNVGRMAVEESKQAIIDFIKPAHVLFVVSGMGGGTGTGAAPEIVRLAKEMDILTIVIATKPFIFEGPQKMKVAEAGIVLLEEHADTFIIVANQSLFRMSNNETYITEAFRMVDQVLYGIIKSITDLIIIPGMINLDFADLKSVTANMGRAMIGSGSASGQDRAIIAVETAITNPLLENISINGAKSLLVNITGGKDMSLHEVETVAQKINSKIDSSTKLIFGTMINEAMEGEIRVVVVATGVPSHSILNNDVSSCSIHVDSINNNDTNADYHDDNEECDNAFNEDLSCDIYDDSDHSNTSISDSEDFEESIIKDRDFISKSLQPSSDHDVNMFITSLYNDNAYVNNQQYTNAAPDDTSNQSMSSDMFGFESTPQKQTKKKQGLFDKIESMVHGRTSYNEKKKI